MISRTTVWLTEAILIALALLAPWAFGSVHPIFELWVAYGVAAVLVLWSVRMIVEADVRRPRGTSSQMVAGGLYALFINCHVSILGSAHLDCQRTITESATTAGRIVAQRPRETVREFSIYSRSDPLVGRSSAESQSWRELSLFTTSTGVGRVVCGSLQSAQSACNAEVPEYLGYCGRICAVPFH